MSKRILLSWGACMGAGVAFFVEGRSEFLTFAREPAMVLHEPFVLCFFAVNGVVLRLGKINEKMRRSPLG
jgi:hypothetical protein